MTLGARALLVPAFASLAVLVGLGTVSCGADEPPATDGKAYWGKPQAAGGTCCDTLGEVRTNIDRIDRQMVALIAERGSYVREAARFKKNPAAVEDKARVEQIIAKLRTLATEDKTSPDVVEATYRALIASFTDEERKVSAEGGKAP